MHVRRRRPLAKSAFGLRRLPLRWQIVGLFLTLFFLVALGLTAMAGRGSQALVDRAVTTAFEASADLALQELHRLQETARAGAEALALSDLVEAVDAEARAARLDVLAAVLRAVPGISAAYVGWPDGTFVLLRPVAAVAESMAVPAGSAWLAQWSDASGARFDFLDPALEVLAQREQADHRFDPRERPWFRDASALDVTVITAPYVFFTTREPGITAARRAPSGAVAGVDLALWDLSARLPQGQPVPMTAAAIVDGEGGVLAFADTERLEAVLGRRFRTMLAADAEQLPTAADLGSPVVARLADRFRAEPAPFQGVLDADDGVWLGTVVPLGLGGTAFVMAAPRAAMATGPEALRSQLLQGFALAMLAAVPLLWLAARLVARPVEAFAAELDRVARLDFGTTTAPLDAPTPELAELEAAIRAMRASMASFAAVCQSSIEDEDVDLMVGRILRHLMIAGRAAAGAAWLTDADGTRRRIVARPEGADFPRIGDPATAARAAALDGPALLRFDEDGDARQPQLLGVPLRLPSGRELGALVIAHGADDAGAFPPSMLALADFVAKSIGLAIERRLLVRELAAARHETELILDTVADGICVVDLDGRIRRQNAAAASMLGWDHSGAPAILEAGAGENAGRSLAETLRDGVTRRIDQGALVRRDGTHFPVELACAALREEGSDFGGAVVSFRDVTDRRRAERTLRRRMEELRCLYEVVRLTADRSRPVGAVASDVAALLAASLPHPDLAVARVVLEGREHESPGWRLPVASIRATIRRGDVVVGSIELGYRERLPDDPLLGPDPVADEAALLEAVAAHVGGMLRERRLAATLTQSERLSAIGELTGGIAHDFNNRLTVILGNAELLERSLPAGSDLVRLATMIRQAAEGGADLNRRLLAFARRQPLNPKPMRLDDLIVRMSDLLRRPLGERIELETAVEPGLWPAMVDPAQLESVILNLVINARDAMPEGGKLSIVLANVELGEGASTLGSEVRPGAYVMIAVSDTGTGIAPDMVEQIFEPFFTTKDVGEGSGLGLSMVFGFVKQSQGHIDLDSTPGQGTTVRLYLPRSTLEAQPEAPSPTTEPIPLGGPERVLLVEDEDLVREHTARLLRSLGYEVVSVETGRRALELLEADTAFDLLFTDVVMPGDIDGLELAIRARRRHPLLPVVVASGHADGIVDGRRALPDDMLVLAKPYRRADVARILRQALATRDQPEGAAG